MRKQPLVTGEVYHVLNRSIAGFKIFDHKNSSERMLSLARYYKVKRPPTRFSYSLKWDSFVEYVQADDKQASNKDSILVQIIAFCLMPTHFHLILKQLAPDGISIFMGNVLNAYSRYFNIKYNRKGPLWEGRFLNKLVTTQEQFLHLTRYIHLNPVTAGLIDKPEEWNASSYKEYLSECDGEESMCCFKDILDMNKAAYKKFVEDRIHYQRTLAIIKDLIID
jgi:putative transposase